MFCEENCVTVYRDVYNNSLRFVRGKRRNGFLSSRALIGFMEYSIEHGFAGGMLRAVGKIVAVI